MYVTFCLILITVILFIEYMYVQYDYKTCCFAQMLSAYINKYHKTWRAAGTKYVITDNYKDCYWRVAMLACMSSSTDCIGNR